MRINSKRKTIDWITYALIAIIELARKKGSNPDVPGWLEKDYFKAIQELAEIGLKEILRSTDSDVTRAILSVLAIAKGLRGHGNLLISYSEEELLQVQLPF